MSKKKIKKKKKVCDLKTPSIDIQNLLKVSVAYHKAGDLNSAKKGYEQILSMKPYHVDALHLAGVIAHKQDRIEDAISLINKAISIKSNSAPFYYNLALVYQSLENFEVAESYYRKAIQLAPNYIDPIANLGTVLRKRVKLLDAIKVFKKVIKLSPRHVSSLYNLASCYRSLGDFDSALLYCEKCLKCDLSNIDANMLLTELLLSKGDFEKGWQGYEWRRYLVPRNANANRSWAPFPRWDGSSLLNKRILLQAEQGVGDEIMFASCVPDISVVAEGCLLECDSRLVPLFSRSFPNVLVVSRSTENSTAKFLQSGPVDWRISIGSLPGIYRKSISDFDSSDSYLIADQNFRSNWRKRLSSLSGRLKVGISWRGGRGLDEQQMRSVALSLWSSVFEVSEVDFINLQYGDHTEEISSFNSEVASPLISFQEYDPLADLDNAAALIAELDLVISIDNATIHLAGALGVPVWVLLPCGSNWRWIKGHENSYWYKSLRAFQQDSFGELAWEGVVGRVAQALCAKVALSESGDNGSEEKFLCTQLAENNQFQKLPEHSGRQVLLLNDTSSLYHWGCSCTSIAIHQQLNQLEFLVASLPFNRLMSISSFPRSVQDFDSDTFWGNFTNQNRSVVEAIEKSDLVIVNGEGSLHGLGALPLKLLYLIYIARKRLNTPVHLINHSCYPTDSLNVGPSLGNLIYQKVYSELNFCGVREIRSARLLKSLGISATLTFDCMPLFLDKNFAARSIEKRKSVVIAGSVAVTNEMLSLLSLCAKDLSASGYDVILLFGAAEFPAVDDLRFISAMGRLCPESFRLVNACSEVEWLTTIGQAQLLISGRFHHSIAATLVKTPFIALETNTPKLDALLEMLSLPWQVSVADEGASKLLTEMIDTLLTTPGKGIVNKELFDNLLELSLCNFKGLLTKEET